MTKNSNLSSLRRLLPLALLALASISHAGHWAVAYSGGTGDQWGYSSSPYSFSNGTYGGGGSGASGTITARFTWTPDYPGDTSVPPSTVYVFERCSASGTSGTGDSIAPSGNNGLGDKPITTIQQLAPSYAQTTVSSTGTRITYKNIGGGTSFTVTASPSASGQINAGVSYAASVAPYAVTIRSDRDESFHKGANGPESNNTDILTPRFGDTWIDPSNYTDGSLDDPVGYYTTPSFTRELIGPWTNPLHEWDVYGKAFRDATFDEWVSVSNKIRYAPDDFARLSDKAGGDPKVVTLKVTDNGGSGISVNATYTLRVHHPYENWRINPNPGLTVTIAPLAASDLIVTGSRKYSTLAADCICKWSRPSAFWDYATWATKVGGTQLRDSLWKAFFKVAEILLSDMGGEAIQAPAGFETVWNNHAEVGATITGGSWSDPKTLFGMKPRYMYEFKPKYYQCDMYGPHGYQGKGERIAAKIFKEYMSGDFYPVENLNNNGEVTL